MVPAAAVHDAGLPEPWVLRIRDGRTERVPVRLGARSAGRIELVDGVSVGDTLVVSPGIEPGQRVRAR